MWFLYKTDNIIVPKIESSLFMWLAIASTLVIFLLDGLRWKSILHSSGINIRLKDGLISHGINVFGTYLPGKVWYILGKAGFIANRYGVPTKDVLYTSTMSQILAIWTGSLVGLIALSEGSIDRILFWLLVGIFLLSTLVLFFKPFHKVLNYILVKIIRIKSEVPTLTIGKSLGTVLIFLIYWSFIALGFYFLTQSLDFDLPFAAGAIFPLSTVVGVISIIAPGGLGVREGFLVAYFVMIGLELKEANAIALASRLWYLIGEVISFVGALLLNNFKLS